MRILINDRLYPNKYSVWRNEEINYFINSDDIEVDILVFKIFDNAGISLEFDYDLVKDYLDDYNIFIFDPNLNHINRYNKRVDGTSYNGKYPGSYLLSKSRKPFIDNYDIVYHIFLNSFNSFNKKFDFPIENQFIHLYPGGGFGLNTEEIDREVRIITTHPLTSKIIEKNSNKFIECLMAPLSKTEIKTKNFDSLKINICFSSLGNSKQKGFVEYIEISKLYKERYPDDLVEFITISNYVYHGINLSPMDYKTLLYVYNNLVDIYINTETGISFNGWPLGLEAASEGCLLITTDPLNSSTHYNLEKDTFIVREQKDEFVDEIHKMYSNRIYMRDIGKNQKIFLDQHIIINGHMEKIVGFMKENIHNHYPIKIKKID